MIQGVDKNPVTIKHSCFIKIQEEDPHKFYVYELGLDYDGLLGVDFFKHYECSIDFNSNLFKTRFKEIPIHYSNNKVEPVILTIPARSEYVVCLQSDKKNSEAICPRRNFTPQTKIPEAIVQTDSEGKFITTIANISSNPVTLCIERINLEPLDYTNDKPFPVNTIFPNHENPSDRETKIINGLRLNHLNQEEREHVINLCLQFSDIFFLEGDKLSFTSEIKHEIITNDAKPIVSKSYRYPQIHKNEVKSQIKTMLEQNIIEESTSPWSSPVWVVPKKADASGKQKYRLVIDYRKLNEVTVGDKYPLPNIADLLDQLGKCSYFSTIDLASGFHQIEVNKPDIPKTAFSVENGHYQFLRMPFGLRNSPSTFQRVMDHIMSGIQNERCLVYMDDIIVYSSTLDEHFKRLTEVFSRLLKSNLKIQPDKCEFLRKEVSYLGHLITDKGVKPNPDKVRCIEKFPQPQNQKDIKSFLGLTGYYRRFIPNYSKLTKPMTKLLQKNATFHFDEECIQAFNTCKQLLVTAPILQYPNFEEEFILTTDASNFAIAGVLSQGSPNNDLPIAYASRTLNGAETRYSVIEKELLAIVWAVKHFRPYLFGRKFKLITDHRPLTWLLSVKDPGSRLLRWRLKLEEYEYTIQYKPGKINSNADALSRIKINHLDTISSSPTVDSKTLETEYNSFTEKLKTRSLIDHSKIKHSNEHLLERRHKHIILFLSKNLSQFPTKYQEQVFKDLTVELELPITSDIIIKSSASQRNKNYYFFFPTDLSIEHNESLTKNLFFIIYANQNDFKENVNYYIQTIDKNNYLEELLSYIFADKNITFTICSDNISTPDPELRQNIISEYHDSKKHIHRGINETIRRIKEKYDWPNLSRDVEIYIKSCDICSQCKVNRKNTDAPLVITETPSKPFERINIDLVEIPNSPNLMTILDEFSKFAQAYVIKNKTAKEVANKLVHFFQHFGTPMRIHCDHGLEFNNSIIKDLAKLYDFRLTFSSVAHPQSNGAIERFHATLLDALRAYRLENPSASISEVIPHILLTYNNSKSSSTGFTPHELLFGHTSSRPPELILNEQELISKYVRDLTNKTSFLYEQAKSNMQIAKEKAKIRFDKHVNKQTEYKEGQLVWLRDSQIGHKLKPKYTGPFKIIQIHKNNSATLLLNGDIKSTVNYDRLKPHFARNPTETDCPVPGPSGL